MSFLHDHDTETGVVTLTLNRPERLNALTFQVYEELAETFRRLDTEPGPLIAASRAMPSTSRPAVRPRWRACRAIFARSSDRNGSGALAKKSW